MNQIEKARIKILEYAEHCEQTGRGYTMFNFGDIAKSVGVLDKYVHQEAADLERSGLITLEVWYNGKPCKPNEFPTLDDFFYCQSGDNPCRRVCLSDS